MRRLVSIKLCQEENKEKHWEKLSWCLGCCLWWHYLFTRISVWFCGFSGVRHGEPQVTPGPWDEMCAPGCQWWEIKSEGSAVYLPLMPSGSSSAPLGVPIQLRRLRVWFQVLELLLNVGLRLLIALKLTKGQSWWKGRFAIFCSLATLGGGQTLVQRPTSPDWQSRQELL